MVCTLLKGVPRGLGVVVDEDGVLYFAFLLLCLRMDLLLAGVAVGAIGVVVVLPLVLTERLSDLQAVGSMLSEAPFLPVNGVTAWTSSCWEGEQGGWDFLRLLRFAVALDEDGDGSDGDEYESVSEVGDAEDEGESRIVVQGL